VGATRGSITFSKFHVRGELPRTFRDRFMKALRLRTFRPLDPKEDLDHRVGWVTMDDPFDLELTNEKVFFNAYLNLGFRVDRWKIPTPLWKAAMRTAEREWLGKRGQEKISRAQKKELEAVVAAQLRKQIVPAMKVVDLSWNLNERVVRFFSQSKKQHELLIELFVKTFELELDLDGVYVAAERRELPKKVVDALPKLEPASFAMPQQKAS
jgi:recombination associated protein RdgC